MKYKNTIYQQQRGDFDGMYNLLTDNAIKSLTINSAEIKKMRPHHDRLFLLKYLIDLNKDKYLEGSKEFFEASISSLIECFLQISLGRYRTAYVLFRSSLEALCGGIYFEVFAKEPGEKFSNNVDQIIKEIIISHTIGKSKRQKKDFKSTVNEYIYQSVKQSLYWKLSDYVHSLKRSYLNSEEYLEDILKVSENFNQHEFENTLIIFEDLLNNLLVLILISDYEFYFKENRESVLLTLYRLSESQKAFIEEWHAI